MNKQQHVQFQLIMTNNPTDTKKRTGGQQ